MQEQWTVEAGTKRNSGKKFSGSLNQILEKYLWMGSFVCKFADLKAEKNEKQDSWEIRIMK